MGWVFQKTENCKIFDYDGNQVLQDIIVMDAEVLDESKIMDHPTESGAVISDHRIFLPKEIMLRCALPEINPFSPEAWESAYYEMESYFINSRTDITVKESLLKIKLRASTAYANMQLVSIPHKESIDTFTRLFFELKFREVKIVEPDYVDMPLEDQEDPSSAGTVDAGVKQAT